MQYNEPSSVPAPGSTQPPSTGFGTPPSYSGNKTDNTATLAMLAGVGLIISSCTGIGGCLIPIFAVVAGVMGLRGANQALDPARTRRNAWIGIVTGGIVLLFFIGIIALYGGAIIYAINSGEFAP